MAEQDAKFLEAFSSWLRQLGEDAQQLATVLSDEAVALEAKKAAAGGLNYLFKSLDLIPDGIDDIGYLDDAFVLRVSAEQAISQGAANAGGLARLAEEAAIVREFLGPSFERLERYVVGLKTGAARGRTVQEILAKERTLDEFLADVHGFAEGYQAPSFSGEPKTLVKLRAFFDAKLPK